jgi:hypothetical protein
MIFGVEEETIHGAISLAAELIAQRGEDRDGYFHHEDQLILEIRDPAIRQTTWGLPLFPALQHLDYFLNNATPPVYIDPDRYDGTFLLGPLDFTDVSKIVAASMFLEYETRGQSGKLCIVASRASIKKGTTIPNPPPLGEDDGFEPKWGDPWKRELAMFVREPGAIGFKDRFFRKVAAPVAAGGAVLKTAPASPWVIAARIVQHEQ